MTRSNQNLIALAVLSLLQAPSLWADQDSMPHMPKIQPKRIITVQGSEGETIQDQRGFGDQEPMVNMMNQMMVEGSGMEGMDMGSMKMAAAAPPAVDGAAIPYLIEVKSESTPPQVGANRLTLLIKNAKDNTPAPGLKLKAKVYMTSMDMGTEEPAIKEASPGKYQLKAPFAMKGPWAVKILFPNGGEKVLNFDVGSSSRSTQ